MAAQQGLRVTGTLGVLDLAAERGLVDFRAAIGKLELTSFRRPETVLRALLAKHRTVRRPRRFPARVVNFGAERTDTG